MDPQATLRLAEEALQAGDLEQAQSHLDDYWAWRRHGGFQPADGDATAGNLAQRIHTFKADTN